MARVIPDLSILRVSALPAPASAYAGQLRRTPAGLWWSDGADWRRMDAPGQFVPITASDYAALPAGTGPGEQGDPATLWVIVADATGLRPTSTWVEVTAVPGSPDPGTLYVVNP